MRQVVGIARTRLAPEVDNYWYMSTSRKVCSIEQTVPCAFAKLNVDEKVDEKGAAG